MNDVSETQEQQIPQQVQCRSTKDPAIRISIAAIMLIGFGVWCFLDREKYPAPATWDLQHINEASKYVMNNIGPFVFIPIGLILGGVSVSYLKRRLIADETGIGYAGKEKIAWDAITELDAEKLKSKGILYVRHGDNKSLTLDSWKLTNFRDLVTLVESKIPKDRQKT